MTEDEQEQDVISKVEKFGWMVMRVSPRLDDPVREGFAYTIGLAKTFGWPELICFGMDQQAMHVMLNNAVEECRDRQEAPAAGMMLKEVLNNYETKLSPIRPEDWVPRLGWARWFSDYCSLPRERLSCLQLVWPDKAGLFPDDPRCAEEDRLSQTPVSDVDDKTA